MVAKAKYKKINKEKNIEKRNTRHEKERNDVEKWNVFGLKKTCTCRWS